MRATAQQRVPPRTTILGSDPQPNPLPQLPHFVVVTRNPALSSSLLFQLLRQDLSRVSPMPTVPLEPVIEEIIREGQRYVY